MYGDFFEFAEALCFDFMPRSLRGETDEKEFNRFALELFELQSLYNKPYRALCEQRRIRVRDIEHWTDVPALPTNAFKQLEVTSVVPGERTTIFLSSGTTQQDRSSHFHSLDSLHIYEESLWNWFSHLFESKLPNTDLVILTPEAQTAPNSSLAHMFGTIANRTAGRGKFLGIIDEDKLWQIDFQRLLSTLQNAHRPVAIFGTAFLFVNLLDELDRLSTKLSLPPLSWILETGGYKGRTREIPKAELHHLLKDRLGVSEIFAEYGMSELSSQAYASEDGLFRFPPWARAQIISPATGREANAGERGLIRIFDLANIWSVMAVQTEDVGIKVDDGIQLRGRADAAEARGCSLLSV
jgi:phenylacetate-coenzyme A ligase PaaK-like adenylate-forming protein